MKYSGTVTQWHPDKGFGFIHQDNGHGKIFFHRSDILNRPAFEGIGQSVVFKTATDRQGRPCAVQVRIPGVKATKATSPKNPSGALSLLLASAFLLVLAGAHLQQRLPVEILLFYVSISLVTFIAYLRDKLAAQKNQWRIQESSLHLFALIGGWPGAAFAQQILRHKSRKTAFRFTFWVTVILNSSALFWLLSEDGLKYLNIGVGSLRQLLEMFGIRPG
ncbi:DUF1294 domain-containing protein [Aestuariicella hydrocarbonica]|uniref:DUF1294 domain-containing protein n=1 Tax=Pseudomaricurvus hydrocarbonicus TaxID=1470433 RepID=A0A9E5MJP0_9GAMM|nr:cold shock and DUF1294 domain-containing protein [Aestuariicella hydrocarbonica]NHO64282.1 DUF1294 domain-containing protein [Aestuariicella hydrocarbonica]